MKDFDLRKYLAENKLLKEDISSHKEEAKYFLEKFIDDNGDTFEFIPDLKTGYIDTKDNSYNVDELASIFLDIGQDIPRGKYNKKYKGKGGTYVVVAEGRLFENTINQISSRISKLGKEAGISSDDIEEYVDGLESSFEPDAYKNITDKELLKDLKLAVKNLAEGKLLNEFVGKELEDRNEPLYDKLVAGSGKSDTVQGEMLRAINRIVYRYYNDGDEYHTGYGTETAGPAHSYLVNANHPLRSLVSTLFKNGTNYEQTIKDVLDAILDHIESRQGKYTPNSEDMYDYEPEFEDDEFEEEDYDDYNYDDYYDDDYDEFDNEEQF